MPSLRPRLASREAFAESPLGKKLKFVFRNFPLSELHPDALNAAEIAEAAALQGKFWEMHDALFENQGNLDEESLGQYAGRLKLDTEKVERVLAATRRSRNASPWISGVESIAALTERPLFS